MAKLRGSLRLTIISIRDNLITAMKQENKDLRDIYTKAIIKNLNTKIEEYEK